MILQALNRHYDRLILSRPDEVPRYGFARQPVPFCLVLNRQGELSGPKVLDLRDHGEKPPRAPVLIVPQPVKRSSGILPNFMWDNTGYVLGADDKGKPERTAETFARFKELQRRVGDTLEDEGMKALLEFLERWDPGESAALPLWEELRGQNVMFRLEGDLEYLHDRPGIRRAWLEHYAARGNEMAGMCLVTGETGPIARLHPSIKGVPGSQTSGAAVVSFNLDAFNSYGKEQNHNAPIGEYAAFAYTTALNWLLRRGSPQKVRIGDTIVLFWAGTEGARSTENLLALILGLDEEKPEAADEREDDGSEPEDSSEDGSEGESEDTATLEDLRLILEAAARGRIEEAVEEPRASFHILGLSPNASRLSIRFWHVDTVQGIVGNIARHFKDMAIVRSYPKDPEFPSVRRLLKETAVLGKYDNVSPLLGGALMRAVLSGLDYPESLLAAVLMRIRSDQNINTPRAGLIKACLVRNHKHEEIGVSLDSGNTDIGYRLGRLFAVLERVQSVANPGISSTIRDKYFGSAAATPRKIFPMLLGLTQRHLGKIRRDGDRKGLAGFFDGKLQEIVDAIPAEALPAFLSPENQGLFAIGYYHQRQDLFTSRSDAAKDNEQGGSDHE